MFDRLFRLNPLFEITPYEALSEKHQKRYAHLKKSGNFHAFLHTSRRAGLTAKALSRDLTELLQKLAEPRRLTELFSHLPEGLSDKNKEFIAQLVIESVLEVELDGEFISGLHAVNRLMPSTAAVADVSDGDGGLNRIQALSEMAIRYALGSALKHPRDISVLLYNFNRIPLCRWWRRRFPGETAIREYLGVHRDGSWPEMREAVRPMERGVRQGGEAEVFDANWLAWKFGRKHPKDRPSYKVYFSPHPDDLSEVFTAVRSGVVGSGAHFMKIGCRLAALLRSDKLVVYFGDYGTAIEFAESMAGKLSGFRAQGVPFSFQISADTAIVSIGIDPPRTGGQFLSWRFYIVNKLALAVQSARRTASEDPLVYLRSYMKMAGVDSVHWRPANPDWKMAFQLTE